MKDYLGQTLAVGDIVVIMAFGYREFSKAQVVGFTKMQVRVKRFGSNSLKLQYPTMMIKIPADVAFWDILSNRS